MKKKTLPLIVLLAGLFCSTAHAGFISTDWKNSGDKLATLHEETGTEWLDLTQTDGLSINYVMSQLGAGGLYEGWRLPTANEVHAMMSSILSDYSSYFRQNVYTTDHVYLSPTNGASAQVLNFWALFGRTQIQFNDVGGAFGMYTDGGRTLLAGPQNGRNEGTGRDRIIYNYILPNTSYSHNAYGVFLVSDGGVSLSSKLDPSININNPNSPAAQTPDEPDVTPPVDVPAPAGFALLAGLMMMLRRKSS
jgi:hypothetical protein